MTEMTAATTAADLRAAHEHGVVRPQLDSAGDGRLVEARPAGARVELGVRAEQLASAGRAAVRAVFLGVDILACERPLGVALAQHPVLLGGQLLPPLLVGLTDLSW